ncbi:3-phosphoshikimate 1-carboxyvinyltransferase [Fulvivirga lutea]|uniref:3-phosphoshikimate 1-carboxyvinyltransferase n=1 Tax=Fulvivirga lutea TaxID=2810512 RepID=A0A974WGQ5_9BACT|nr:3-phosphoshikimate 1-carboxyvinyltransferase [Fulvivirga lutea]QSE97755.1 3-phosphoshikimate 1-carboxyvinyltransferase [Fulvivirga lutea]
MSEESILLPSTSNFDPKIIQLPASKSVANRALIVHALAKGKSEIKNLSEARDTQTMIRLLHSDSELLDVLDAGTTMRFLTAFLAITNQHKILTGTARMKERPIGILVDSLKSIGAKISYVEREGFPPIKIEGFAATEVKEIKMRGDVSSQYISALMMVAPLLKGGLKINLEGKIGSKPYIEMTLAVMKHFGAAGEFSANVISIPPQKYKDATYSIEPDWSAASYWYSLVALSKNSSITLAGLKPDAIQGDSVIWKIMQSLGVNTTFNEEGAVLTKAEYSNSFEYDFTHCPDLAQTVAVVCAAKGIKAKFTGLESLKIKETDRVKALQVELSKFGAALYEVDNVWILEPAPNPEWDHLVIDTYEDHRMAMAFAPLCMLGKVEIKDPSVVNKSYPGFWNDFRKVGLA